MGAVVRRKSVYKKVAQCTAAFSLPFVLFVVIGSRSQWSKTIIVP
jgi:hypothetical protein